MVPSPKFKNTQHFSKASGKDRWSCNICTPAERAEQESMTRADAVRHERTRAHTRLVEKAEPDEWAPGYVDTSGWAKAFEWFTSWEGTARADKMPDYIPFWRDGVLAAERGEEVGKMEEFLHRLDREIHRRNPGISGPWGRKPGLDVWGDSPARPAPNAWGSKKQKLPQKTGQWETDEAAWGPVWGADHWSVSAGDWGVTNEKPTWGETDPAWNDGRDPDHGCDIWGGDGGWGVPADPSGVEWGVPAGGAVGEVGWGMSTATESSRKDDTAAADGAHCGLPGRDLSMFAEKVTTQGDMSPARRKRMLRFSKLSTEEKIRQIQDAARSLRTLS